MRELLLHTQLMVLLNRLVRHTVAVAAAPLMIVVRCFVQVGDYAYHLRPEAIETLFYLWRATGEEIYREWGWNMFRAMEKWLRMPTGGYATAADVSRVSDS